MARDGFSFLACAGVVLSVLSGLSAKDKDPIRTALEVQTALQQGRAYQLRGQHGEAVRVLESRLAYIDGSRDYLVTLRNAYREYIKELRMARRDTEAALYADRLRILESGNDLEKEKESPPAVEEQPRKVRAKTDSVPAPTPLSAASAKNESAAPANEARQQLQRAEEEFRTKNYTQASELYAAVERAAPELLAEARERWAYCRLHRVVARLNQTPAGNELNELEGEIKSAVAQAPKLKPFSDQLLTSIQTRRSATAIRPPETGAAGTEQAPIEVKHSRSDNWLLAETSNFRVFHQQDSKYAEMVASVAESTRTRMQKKWFGRTGPTWNPRCDIYLHANAQAYSQATQQSPYTPGHATIAREGSRIKTRAIHLHVDEANLLTAILPHEATHVVLAGCFGAVDLPRWADEGMAVLSEPDERVGRHLRNLAQARQARQTLTVKQLFSYQDNWPEKHYMTAFYAQSVSVVDYLCGLKGPTVFSHFLAEGMHSGYETALRKHYGIQSMDELETRWVAHAETTTTEAGYARR